ncbi:DUF3558 family protein [Saccharopolyspora spinosa]|uniref:DUF3558 family protein n=1 Tax=Saccharopolyspora spinosa TaxID=60894 RepID=UPI000A018201|nr:DUF3558 family protein [Saccharopolyspora spinosa]
MRETPNSVCRHEIEVVQVGRNASCSAALAAFLSLLLGAAACSSEQPGAPAPTDQLEPTYASSAYSGLAAMDACQVFSPDQASQLGMEGTGEVKNFAGGRGCDWKTADGGIRVVLYDTTALDQLNLSDGRVEPTTFASRDARIQRDALGPGDCSLLFAVGGSSSVSLDASSNDMNTDAACLFAQQVGQLVEAKLPEN